MWMCYILRVTSCPHHCRADYVVVLFVCVEIRPEQVVTEKQGKTIRSIWGGNLCIQVNKNVTSTISKIGRCFMTFIICMFIMCRIWGSPNGDHEDYRFLGCDAVLFDCTGTDTVDRIRFSMPRCCRCMQLMRQDWRVGRASSCMWRHVVWLYWFWYCW
jgi:hypothetical protein